ncbi:MAG TPA: phosphoglycerate kinase [Rhabdochlamydiaceae bacterium]|jgi:phosphoglycerate kinase|nr:phosphoglycerate kinase [Rhabdochlamydiaceae bacterium]
MKLTIQDLVLAGKKVLIRVDFNAPLNKDGTIADDTRIKESIPTIQHALQQGAAVILMSHLGRPKSKKDVQYSLGICAKKLSQLISAPVLFATDCLGKDVEKMVQDLKGGQVLLLENLRFYPAEEDPSLDPNFAKELSKFGDFYVNDAFGTAHRNHSSTAVIAQYFPGKAAMGLLMQKEIQHLEPLLKKPAHPFFVLIGGAKVSTKIGVLKSFLKKVDALFIGGGMAFSFFKAQGLEIGNSIFEETSLLEAENLLKECQTKKIPLHLPTDIVIADGFRNDATFKTVPISKGIPKGWMGMDIGPETISVWSSDFQKAATLFWNGPVGVFEFPHFARGTQEMAKAISSLNANTIVGGGDSVAAINQLGLSEKFKHVSTGGGASLEYLELGKLPGIEALSDKLS